MPTDSKGRPTHGAYLIDRPGDIQARFEVVKDKGKEVRTMKARHTKRAASHWSKVRALVSEGHEKGYGPEQDVWADIVKMATELGAGAEEVGEVEEAFRYKFEQDGIDPDKALSMARDAAVGRDSDRVRL